jgi:predicted SpoU family rRNA methylase
LCWYCDLSVYPQELIDQIRVSLMAQRRMTQRLLAASGLPPMSDEDETVHNSLNEVIQDWTAQVSPITSRQSPPLSRLDN